MNRYKAYQVVHGIGRNDLEQKVNEAIKDNWIPLGGVSVAISPSTTPNEPNQIILTQALVQLEENTTEGRSIRDMPESEPYGD